MTMPVVLCASCGARVPIEGDAQHVITQQPIDGDARVTQLNVDCLVTNEQRKEGAYQRFLGELPSPTLEPKDCRHLEFASFLSVARLEDTGKFVAELRVICIHCREPFRFVGLTPGLSFVEPSCSIDGREALLPIEPEVEKRLFAGARYQMPSPPEPRQ